MTRSVPAEATPALCGAVGHCVINWALVDHALERWSTIIFHLAGGKHLHPRLQRSLDRRIDFLRRCFKVIAPLEPYDADALDCILQAKRLSEKRHFIVHGVLSHFDSTDGTVIFVKLDLTEDCTRHKINELKIRLPDLLAVGSECQELSARMMHLSQRMLDKFVPEDQRDPLFSV